MFPGLCFGSDALDYDVSALAFVEELLQQCRKILSRDGRDLDGLQRSVLLREVRCLTRLSITIEQSNPNAESHLVTRSLFFCFFVEDLRYVHLLVLVTIDPTGCYGAEDLIGASLEVIGLSPRCDEVDGETSASDGIVCIIRLDGDTVSPLLLLTKFVEETVLKQRLQQAKSKALTLTELLVSDEGELDFTEIPLGIYFEGALDDTLTGAVVTDRVGTTWCLGVAR